MGAEYYNFCYNITISSNRNKLSGSNHEIYKLGMNQANCDLLDRLTNSAGTGLPFKKPCMLLHW